ncbi:hypothetical protein N0V82_002210 [Gnomoniopsis sp. IMI 355080]|nr:hypothetical protein N0V82_002210 [Gnomoniopsis sp. IMI 355080]
MNQTIRRRAGASGSTTQPKRQAAAPAANTGAANVQVPLFGPAVTQQAKPSPEQIALERQRLTTTYDPLNPPDDDPTTAEGVRMGVVSDHDGRHWRQQTMRLGRWINHWKDMEPFASEPVDVNELTKAEKDWLDIKFRRRILTRRTPIKLAPGRGCTGRYWSLRHGNRGFQSGRVKQVSSAPSSKMPASRKDDGPGHPSGPGEGPDDPFGLPRDFFYRPLPESVTRKRNYIFTAPLLRESLGHFGLFESEVPETLFQQLRNLVPHDLFSQDNFLEHYPKVKDIPSPILNKMGRVIRAAGLVTTESAAPKTTGSPTQSDKAQQATTRAKELQQFERDILKEAGLSYTDLPSVFMQELTKALSYRQARGVKLTEGMRSYYATKAAAAAAAGRPVIPGRKPSETTRVVTLRLSSGIEVMAEETNVGTVPEHSGAVIINCDPEVNILEEPSTKLVDIKHGGRSMRVPQNKLGDYMNAIINPSPPLDETGMVLLSPPHGLNIAVPEALVGTLPEHTDAIILNCTSVVGAFIPASRRLVKVDYNGVLERVPDNRLDSYLGGLVNPSIEPNKAKEAKRLPAPSDRTINLKRSDGVEINVPVSHVDNFRCGGATILSDSSPPASDDELFSGGMVRITRQADDGRTDVEIPVNRLGFYQGLRIVQPRPTLPQRRVLFKGIVGITRWMPVAQLNNLQHQGGVILQTNPAHDSFETASRRLVHIRTTYGADIAVPDNQLGRYPDSVVLPQPKPDLLFAISIFPWDNCSISWTDQDQLVVLTLSDGRNVKVPVGAVSAEHYNGAKIVRTIPESSMIEPGSARLVHISSGEEHADVLDNSFGLYHGWIISSPPDTADLSPVDFYKGVRGYTASKENGPRVPTAEKFPEEGRRYTAETYQADAAKNTTGRTTVFTQGNKSTTRSQTQEGGPVDDEPELVDLAQADDGHDLNPDRFLLPARSRTLPGRKRPRVIFDLDSPSQWPSSRTGANRQSQRLASQQGHKFNDEPALLDLNQSDDGAGFGLYGASTPSKTSSQAKTSTQGYTSTQSKTSTQGDPAAKTDAATKGNTSTRATTSTQVIPSTRTNPPLRAGTAPSDADDAETIVDYPVSMLAPEYIWPTKKDFPNGRPDKNGNFRPPPAPRGDPIEAERLRLAHERRIAEKAVDEYIATTSAGEPAGPDSIVGAVTDRAGTAPAINAAQQRQRPRIEGTSRANVRAQTTGSVRPAQPQLGRKMGKSSRVVKPGKGVFAKRSVRFGPLPTEEDTGRARGSGLRTRSGALYGPEGRPERRSSD